MSRPLEFRVAVDIDRPAELVWAVLSDYRSDPSWRRGVETMDPDPSGPVVVGTTTREVLRFGGRTYRSDGVVDAVGPGRQFTWHTVSGTDASGARHVEELQGDRCRVVLELNVVPRPSERLMVPVLRRMLARTLRSDLARLAQRVDGLMASEPA